MYMFSYRHTLTFAALLICLGVLSYALIGIAEAQQNFNFLQPLPGQAPQVAVDDNLFPQYLQNVFQISISTAAILAVVMITVGGVQYVGSSVSPSQKSEAKDTIFGAILGLLIVVGAYAILNTINPDLVNFQLNIPCADTTQPC